MARNDAFLTEDVKKKWKPVLEHESMPELKDQHRKVATTIMLENQHQWMVEKGMVEESNDPINLAGGNGNTPGNGNINNWDPVLISLVRRSQPNMLAFDIAGVQPMTGPTGLIFALRSRYDNPTGAEALFNEPNTAHSGRNRDNVYGAGGTNTITYNTANGITLGTEDGDSGTNDAFTVDVAGSGSVPAGFEFSPFDTVTVTNLSSGTVVSVDPQYGTSDVIITVSGATTSSTVTADIQVEQYDYGSGIATDVAEVLGGSGNPWNEMAFSIERTQVTAESRALKASYSVELAQDLRAIHGLDAQTELSNILTTEIMAEQNRELIRRVNFAAKLGGTNDAGVFDVQAGGDFNGRWFGEKWKRLLFQIELEANKIAVDTRRGKGNFVICSANVASALSMAGAIDHAPAIQSNLSVDVTGNLFAGVLLGRVKVYIDPFAPVDYCTVGFRGQNQYDAGIYWAPYVPLEMYRATGEDNFQPRMGFKTRYGVVANPFTTINPNGTGEIGELSGLGKNQNYYFRKFLVKNLY